MTTISCIPNAFFVRQNSNDGKPIAITYWRGSEAFFCNVNGANESIVNHLKSYLVYWSKNGPQRIQRTVVDGTTLLKTAPLSLENGKDAAIVANKLTFSVLNKHNFVFSPHHANSKELKSAVRLIDEYISADLFCIPDKLNTLITNVSPEVQCLCSEKYHVFRKRCPKCGRLDALGYLWHYHHRIIVQHLSTIVDKSIEANANRSKVESLVDGASKFIQMVDVPPNISKDSDGNQTIKTLLDYYDGIFKNNIIDKSAIDVIKHLPETIVQQIVSDAVCISVVVRRCWSDGAYTGWIPGGEFAKTLYGAIKEPIDSIVVKCKDLGGSLALVIAMYSSIRSYFIKTLNPSWWKKAINLIGWGMAGLGAIPTFGLSIALKAAMKFGVAYIKDKAQQKRYAKFVVKLNELRGKCESYISAVNGVQYQVQAIEKSVAGRLVNHMLMVLAHDYASSSNEQRIRIATELARSSGIHDWKIPSLKPISRIRKIMFWVAIAIGVFAALCLLLYFATR